MTRHVLPPCPSCSKPTESSLACLECGTVLREPKDVTHFERLGMALCAVTASDEIERRYLRLSRLLHPDFHGEDEQDVRELAVRNSALLNEAYEVLTHDELRAEYLLGLQDPEVLQRTKTLAPEFLMEAMERSEEVEGARKRDDSETLKRLADEVREEIRNRMLAVTKAWNADKPDIDAMGTLLHEVRVFRRILRDIGTAA